MTFYIARTMPGYAKRKSIFFSLLALSFPVINRFIMQANLTLRRFIRQSLTLWNFETALIRQSSLFVSF